MSEKKRIGYIDIAKCIAIVFVIIGHMGLVFSSFEMQGGMPNVLVGIAFTFHLPLFFIASGYFFPVSKGLSKGFVIKSIKSLLLPYAITAILIIVGCTLMSLIRGTSTIDCVVEWTLAALYGAGSITPVAFIPNVMRIGAIWFLLALFWARLLIAITHKLNEWVRLFVMALCTAIAAISQAYVWLPFSVQSGLGCALFIYIGMMARKYKVFEKKGLTILVLCLCILAWIYVMVFGGGMSLAMQVYPLGAIDIIGGIAASVVVMFVSRQIDEHVRPLSKFMQWIGRNTLAIFCVHNLEDDVFSWHEIGVWFSNALEGWSFTWIVVLLLRFAVDALLVAIVYIIPGIRRIYFPQIAKRKEGLST